MFTIYENGVPTPGTMRIYLEEFLGEVTVMAEDDEGYEWYICSLKEGKKMKLHAELPGNIGFPVDKGGCILVDEET